jgi:DNA-binding response OmpR family regulator
MSGGYNMSKKILIVDDEPDILAVTVTRLETSGYEVLMAKDGEEALKLLKKSKPDLILLDLLLPKMQGDELCKKLKSDVKFKHMPIILFTASIIRVPAKVEEMGADDYILKPFEPEELLFKIKKFIG